MTEFSIDRSRLERYHAEAQAARGERQKAGERISNLRLDQREVDDDVQRIERSHVQEPRRLEVLKERAQDLADELDKLTHANAERAAAHDHSLQLASRLDAYAKERGILR